MPGSVGLSLKNASLDASVYLVTTNPAVSYTLKAGADVSLVGLGDLGLSGTVEVRDKSIDMDLDVPFLLKPFQGQAISVIEGEIKSWLSKEKAGG